MYLEHCKNNKSNKEKISGNCLDNETNKFWKPRNNKQYQTLNNRYTDI